MASRAVGTLSRREKVDQLKAILNTWATIGGADDAEGSVGEAQATAIIKERPTSRKDDSVQKKIIRESVYNLRTDYTYPERQGARELLPGSYMPCHLYE